MRQDCGCGLQGVQRCWLCTPACLSENNGSLTGTNLPVPRLGGSPSVEDVLGLLAKVAAELKGSGWPATVGRPEPPSVQVWYEHSL